MGKHNGEAKSRPIADAAPALAGYGFSVCLSSAGNMTGAKRINRFNRKDRKETRLSRTDVPMPAYVLGFLAHSRRLHVRNIDWLL